MAMIQPMAPVNYGIDVQDPSQAFLQAFKTGTAITETRMAQEKAQREAEQQQRITQAFDRLRQPGASAKDYADLAMMLPETQAKAVRESFNLISGEHITLLQGFNIDVSKNDGILFGLSHGFTPKVGCRLLIGEPASDG